MLILKVVLVLLVLAAALWGVARMIHSFLYTEVPADLYWRAPPAAGVIWAVGLVGPLIYNSGGGHWPVNFEDMFLFKETRQPAVQFKEFVVKGEGGRETVYQRVKSPRGRVDYLDSPGPDGRPIPAGTNELTGVTEDGQRIAFRVERDRAKNRTRYVEEGGGRVMSEEEFGTLTAASGGQALVTLLGIVLTALAIFASFWLLLLLQWPHALGFTIPALLVWAFGLNFLSFG
jgi:hypothetical protein